MSQNYLKFNSVTFGYDSAAEWLFEDISFHIASGWTGVVGPNGSGKTTLLKLATMILVPETGYIDSPPHCIYCQQRTDDPPERMVEFLMAESKEANILKHQLAVGDDWFDRWQTLSHGERKRSQLAVALWMQPDLLAIDEPTNHLDLYARNLIKNALHVYNGVCLLVSHDRDLLDSLCDRCIFTFPPEIIIRPGGVTQAMAAIKQEQQAAQKQYRLKKKALKKIQRETIRRRQEAQQADRKRSKRGLSSKDHDAREKIDRARISGKDGHAGKLQRQIEGRLNRLQHEFDSIKIEKTHTLGISLPGSHSKRNYLLHLPAGCITLGGDKQLSFPTLFIKPGDRIAVTGRNGTGKSSLVRHILSHLNVEPEHLAYIPQEIDRRNSNQILEQALALPKNKLGYLMTIISRLNSLPERLLSSVEPSPGEIRKLLLALGMTDEPHIIIMDEPTNHLDLQSIECLENALIDCHCALMLVSHDTYFLQKLTSINWEISEGEKELFFKVHVL